MNELFIRLSGQAHAIAGHFPLSLLVVSIALDVLSRRWPALRPSAWLVLLIGSAGALVSTITGLLAHLPYEESQWAGAIEVHQYLAFATTAVFVTLTIWRWRAQRRGEQIGVSGLYLAASLLGLVILMLTGFYGGRLVYELGVGVKGISR